MRASRKLMDVEAKIVVLERIRRTLGGLVTACKSRRPTAPCPILESLAARATTNDRTSKR
jgi:hypothetical protein